MLGIGAGAAAEEVEAEAAPAFGGIEIAIGILAFELLAFQELGDFLHFLPGLRHFPFALMTLILPRFGEVFIGKVIGPVVEVMRVAIDGDAILLAVPRTDGRLQIIDDVIKFDLLLDPVRHLRGQALAADIALEGGAHFDDVEINRAGGDRLLQARIVIGLGEIDPADLGAGIGLPRLEEAAEQKIVKVLVVKPHEGELDALELAFLDTGLGGAEAHLADLLPVGIGGRALADTRNLQKLGAQF